VQPFNYHVYICGQKKPEGVASCSHNGASQNREILMQELNKSGLSKDVRVVGCECLGLCEKGPNMVVYPDGVWYGNVKSENISNIVHKHFKCGITIEQLTLPRKTDPPLKLVL